jgi:hypothetical protein
MLGVLTAGVRPGGALAYQSGSGETRPGMMRSNIAAGGSTAPPAAAFQPSPVVSVEAIERAQREAHRLRAEVIQEMLGGAWTWVRRLGRRTIPSRRSV